MAEIRHRISRSGRCAAKAIGLTWGGLCHVPISELRAPRGVLTVAQKSADGIVGQAVGKASEALQSRKAEQQIGRAGNDGRRPERWGVASRTGNSGVECGRRASIHWPWNRPTRVKPRWRLPRDRTSRGEASTPKPGSGPDSMSVSKLNPVEPPGT